MRVNQQQLNNSIIWDYNFPKGYGHTSIAFLRRQPDYELAKNGNIKAAKAVVDRCIKRERIEELCMKYPKAILIPVITENKLPQALCEAIGLPLWDGVQSTHIVKRKTLTAAERLLHKPIFKGSVIPGLSYILVDDVVTQGGTISALREFVIRQGGNVVAVVALAFAIGSHDIAPLKVHKVMAKVKHSFLIDYLLRKYKIANSVDGRNGCPRHRYAGNQLAGPAV